MNERIRSLMEQASSNACYDEPGQLCLMNVEIERFAELIVLECQSRVQQFIDECVEIGCLPKTVLIDHFGASDD
jgi:hypothetical protein